MKIIFLGATKFSEAMLKALLAKGVVINTLFSIPEYFSISYSDEKVRNYNFSDLESVAKENNIQHFEIDSVDGKRLRDYFDLIKEIKPDVILVMGWYYMVPKKIRELAKYGAWGIHASLLPKYAGGAPLVWSMIEGENETGVTLFKLDSGVDDGDIIAQRAFPIEPKDTIKEVYAKATVLSQEILVEAFLNFDKVKFTPQDKEKIEVYPQRSPKDGKIDWSWDSIRIKNFIRAQTRPYPGAFTFIQGKKVIIWDADIIDENEN